MKNGMPMARIDDLVISELPDEVLVYDLKTNQAHCLNRLAASIWRQCDGKKSVTQIQQRLEIEERTLLEEQIVWAALEQLSQNDLLVESVKRPTDVPAFSRRRAMRKIGLGAAAALPIVMSVVAPNAVSAQSTCVVGVCRTPVTQVGSAAKCGPCAGVVGTCFTGNGCSGNDSINTCQACGGNSWRA